MFGTVQTPDTVGRLLSLKYKETETSKAEYYARYHIRFIIIIIILM